MQKAKPLLDPSHVSRFCDTGLTSENSALHSHRCFQNLQGPHVRTCAGKAWLLMCSSSVPNACASNCSTLSVFRFFFFVAGAAVALLPDVVGRLAFVSLPNSASVIAGVESAASEAKPATDSAFELTSASSGSLSALASDSPSVGE